MLFCCYQLAWEAMREDIILSSGNQYKYYYSYSNMTLTHRWNRRKRVYRTPAWPSPPPGTSWWCPCWGWWWGHTALDHSWQGGGGICIHGRLWEENVDGEREPLPHTQEEEGGQHVEAVLGQYQGVQTGALVNGVLVLCHQLVKSYQL